jgi:hypothetical protein
MAFIHATFRNARTDTTHTVYMQTRSFSLCRVDIDNAERKLEKSFPTTWDDFRLIALEYKST